MLIFAQEKRTTVDNVAYLGHDLESGDRVLDPDLDVEKIATLNHKQRKLVNEGIEQIAREDHALRKCVRTGGNYLKTMMCMLPVALSVNGVASYTVNNITQPASQPHT